MAQGSFVYSSAGTSVGSWAQILAGSEASINFIPQANWNQDTRISADPNVNLDPTKGNVYQIKFQYLGFGAIDFYIEDRDSGDFVLVHRIKFANSSTSTSVSNPSFRVGWVARNVGNTSNVTVSGGSAAAFNEGIIYRDTPPRGQSNNQLSIGTALTNVLSLRNRATFSDKVNRAEIFPALLTVSTQTNKFAFFRIILNPVYSAPVTFNYVDKSSSIAEVAFNSVTVSGGQELGVLTAEAGSPDKLVFNQAPGMSTQILPGDTWCIAAEIPTGAASDCQASLTSQDDL